MEKDARTRDKWESVCRANLVDLMACDNNIVRENVAAIQMDGINNKFNRKSYDTE